MSDQKDTAICVHIDITEIMTNISSARVGFNMADLRGNIDPEKRVEILIPFQVLMSLAQSLPQVLQDMHQMGAGNTIFTGGGGRPEPDESQPH